MDTQVNGQMETSGLALIRTAVLISSIHNSLHVLSASTFYQKSQTILDKFVPLSFRPLTRKTRFRVTILLNYADYEYTGTFHIDAYAASRRGTASSLAVVCEHLFNPLILKRDMHYISSTYQSKTFLAH